MNPNKDSTEKKEYPSLTLGELLGPEVVSRLIIAEDGSWSLRSPPPPVYRTNPNGDDDVVELITPVEMVDLTEDERSEQLEVELPKSKDFGSQFPEPEPELKSKEVGTQFPEPEPVEQLDNPNDQEAQRPKCRDFEAQFPELEAHKDFGTQVQASDLIESMEQLEQLEQLPNPKDQEAQLASSKDSGAELQLPSTKESEPLVLPLHDDQEAQLPNINEQSQLPNPKNQEVLLDKPNAAATFLEEPNIVDALEQLLFPNPKAQEAQLAESNDSGTQLQVPSTDDSVEQLQLPHRNDQDQGAELANSNDPGTHAKLAGTKDTVQQLPKPKDQKAQLPKAQMPKEMDRQQPLANIKDSGAPLQLRKSALKPRMNKPQSRPSKSTDGKRRGNDLVFDEFSMNTNTSDVMDLSTSGAKPKRPSFFGTTSLNNPNARRAQMPLAEPKPSTSNQQALLTKLPDDEPKPWDSYEYKYVLPEMLRRQQDSVVDLTSSEAEAPEDDIMYPVSLRQLLTWPHLFQNTASSSGNEQNVEMTEREIREGPQERFGRESPYDSDAAPPKRPKTDEI